MMLFQCIVCVCNTKLVMYCKQHVQCNITARWRGLCTFYPLCLTIVSFCKCFRFVLGCVCGVISFITTDEQLQ